MRTSSLAVEFAGHGQSKFHTLPPRRINQVELFKSELFFAAQTVPRVIVNQAVFDLLQPVKRLLIGKNVCFHCVAVCFGQLTEQIRTQSRINW